MSITDKMPSSRIIAFSLFLTIAAQAQNSLPVTFLQNPSRNTHIGTFERSGIIYGSLDDLARTFIIDTYNDSGAEKLELRTEAYTITTTADNPFILLTNLQHNSNVVQLHAEVRHAVARRCC